MLGAGLAETLGDSSEAEVGEGLGHVGVAVDGALGSCWVGHRVGVRVVTVPGALVVDEHVAGAGSMVTLRVRRPRQCGRGRSRGGRARPEYLTTMAGDTSTNPSPVHRRLMPCALRALVPSAAPCSRTCASPETSCPAQGMSVALSTRTTRHLRQPLV